MRRDRGQKLERIREGKYFEKGDAWVFAGLLLLVIALTLAAFAFRGKTGGKADVYVNGELVQSLDLGKNARYTAETDAGFNVIVVEGGAVYVAEADCGDHTCMRYGKISRTGETIVCLPHGLKIVLTGAGEGSDV